MRSAFGNITKEKNGTYRVRWSENGQRKSKRCKTYKEATEIQANARLMYGGTNYNLTYNDYYNGVIKKTYNTISKRTRYQYESSWELLKPKVEKMRISDTNWRFIQNTISEFPSWSKQRKVLALWRKILNFAVRDEIIRTNPTANGVQLIKPKKREKPLYTKDELKEVLEQVKGTRYGIAVLIMCVCGLRLEEYCGLNTRDFDFIGDEGWVYITVRQAVTSVNGSKVIKEVKTPTSARTIALHRDFTKYLSEHNKFMTNKRTLADYLNPASFNRNWHNYCDRNGIKYCPMGFMRSVYATLSAEAGCLDSVVSKSMGHIGNNVRERNYMSATMQALKLNATTLAEYIDYDDMREY